jgi:hypothetical protein
VPSGYNFTTLDPPGSTFTQGHDINNPGQIVGDYHGADGIRHGFLKSGDNWSTIDVPGSNFTQALGINASGQIVGTYVAVADGEQHGFLKGGDNWSRLDVPGSTFTSAYGINASGQIVGTYIAGGTPHGFLKSGDNWSTIDPPGSAATTAAGINDDGLIVGHYNAGGSFHGFLLNLSNWYYTMFDVPGSTNTYVYGVNSSGQIVGQYDDVGFRAHGFLLDWGSYTTIDPPGSTSTDAAGINNNGLIVGTYDDSSGRSHGFLATPTVSVQSLVINDGSVQRSMVNSLTATFSTIVTMAPGAFEVRHQNADLVTVNFTSSVVGNQTVAVVTFAGSEIIGGSLADGNYTLTVLADHLHDANGNPLESNYVTSFYRLFGDTQGHRTVNADDVAVLFAAFGKHAGEDGYVSYLDYNGDGAIDDIDLYAFIAHYGTTLDP